MATKTKTSSKKRVAPQPADVKALAHASLRPGQRSVPAVPAFDHTVRAMVEEGVVMVDTGMVRSRKGGEPHHKIKIGVPGVLMKSIQTHCEGPWTGNLLKLADYALHRLLEEGKTLQSEPNEFTTMVGESQVAKRRAKATAKRVRAESKK